MAILSIFFINSFSVFLLFILLKQKTPYFLFLKYSALLAYLIKILSLFFLLDNELFHNNSSYKIIVTDLLDNFYIIISLFFFSLFIKNNSFQLVTLNNKKLNLFLLISIIFSIFFIVDKIIYHFSLANYLYYYFTPLKILSAVVPLVSLYYWNELKKNNKLLFFLSTILCFIVFFIDKSRHGFLFFIFFLIILTQINLSRKILLTFFLFILLFIFLINYYISFTDSFFSNKNIFESSGSLNIEIKDLYGKLANRVLHKYIITPSAFDFVFEIFPIGFEPLKSSLIAFIPASLYSLFDENKPFPGSTDGINLSAFEYLVNQLTFGPTFDMSEYPISLSLVWQGGFFYFFISTFFCGFLSAMIFKICFKFDKTHILALTVIQPFTYQYYFPDLHKVPLIIYYNLLPLIFIFLIINFLYKNKTKQI